jgi:hypothetical protein
VFPYVQEQALLPSDTVGYYGRPVSRYRLYPTPAQETALLSHCTHARYVWNLAVEQRDWWQPGRLAPGYAEQCRQLSEARAAFPWLAEGSVIVQQQALRDFQAAQVSWSAALRQWRKRYVKIPPGRRPTHPASLASASADSAKGSGSSPADRRTCGPSTAAGRRCWSPTSDGSGSGCRVRCRTRGLTV